METVHVQTVISLASLVLYFIARGVIKKLILAYANKEGYAEATFTYVNKVMYSGLLLVVFVVNAIVWNWTLKGLGVYAASFFTLFGIAFFAVWSILSNITASVLLFFTTPIKVGNRIKIIDGDNSVTGKVLDFTLFNIRIKLDNEELITYPNNLALQKPISQLPELPTHHSVP